MGSRDEYVTVELVREGYIPAWTRDTEVIEAVYTEDYPPELGDSVCDGSFMQIDIVGEVRTAAGIVMAIRLSRDNLRYSRNSSSDIANPRTPERYTLTINPTPNDATVTLTATGETQVGNSITADDGTTISYTVSATGYVTALEPTH